LAERRLIQHKEICGGETGHAEAIEITFDPEKFHLENFWNIFCHHDPTSEIVKMM
jgi:peptide-methionine (S)-S-oxide reductase